MTTLGSFTYVWREPRYLPLVLEQHNALPGPSVILWCRWPFYWLAEGDPPDGYWDPRMQALLSARDDVILWDRPHTGLLDATAEVVNAAAVELQRRGADSAFWMDSDVLFELNRMEKIAKRVGEYPPCMWNFAAVHYWRDFSTAYSHGRFRMIVQADAEFSGRSGYPAEAEADVRAMPDDIMAHHASYVLSDEEIRQKTNTWFHAPDFAGMYGGPDGFYEAWVDGSADERQELVKVVGLPESIRERLLSFDAL